ncbi:hypothetical protein KHA80_02375 [Anaerobacillus sp. HL2]|nr:hypothetical protein KHA80_02375 [Anaerobacillus sp. HL2]
MTAPHVQIKETLESVKNYLQRPFHDGRAELLGVHLEGPFLSPFQNGAQPNDHIIKPDLALLESGNKLSSNRHSSCYVSSRIRRRRYFRNRVGLTELLCYRAFRCDV